MNQAPASANLRLDRILWSATRAVAAALATLGITGLPAGCGSPLGPIDAGNVGVTPGGEQDVAAARAELAAGYVPDPNSITVEGFLSEHDIPLSPPEGAPEIYAAYALSWRKPITESAPVVDLFVSLGSTIDVSTFQRRPQNLVVAVDRSGSMAYSASATDHRAKLDAVKQALHALLNRLGPDDRITLISFSGDPRLDVEAARGDEKDRVSRRIDALKAEGATDLFTALRYAFQKGVETAAAERDSRVILFTDVQPTEGATNTDDFVSLATEFSDRVGFTLMGVGIDYGQDLARRISNVRGGNAFFLADSDRISGIFDEFDYFVTPAAYDLTLTISLPDGVGVREVYGVPDYVPGSRGAIVRVPTLFFSKREGGGAIVVRLTLAAAPSFEAPVTVAFGSLTYTLRTGELREMSGELALPAGLSPTGEPAYFSDEAARRAALLLDTALTLKTAAQAAWDGRHAAAATLIETFLPQFDAASQGLSNRTDPSSRGLSDERRLLEQMLGAISF